MNNGEFLVNEVGKIVASGLVVLMLDVSDDILIKIWERLNRNKIYIFDASDLMREKVFLSEVKEFLKSNECEGLVIRNVDDFGDYYKGDLSLFLEGLGEGKRKVILTAKTLDFIERFQGYVCRIKVKPDCPKESQKLGTQDNSIREVISSVVGKKVRKQNFFSRIFSSFFV